MLTVSQVARIANVAPNTVRNYAREFPDLFSEAARGLQGNRLFDDDDVAAFCTLVQLRASGLALSEAAERLRSNAAPHVIEGQITRLQEAASDVQVGNDLERRLHALERQKQASVGRVLWSHGIAYYLGMVTMGAIFLFVWWMVNG